MIRINCNVTGVPTDNPTLTLDDGTQFLGDIDSSPNRCTFTMPDGIPPHGATVNWDDKEARTLLALVPGQPLGPGDYEGGMLAEPIPTLSYIAAAPIPVPPTGLVVSGEHFYMNGERWKWRGSTEFYLAAKLDAGEDIQGIINQRRTSGINLFRTLSMINWDWAPHWGPLPNRPHYWESVEEYWSRLADNGLFCEWTVFAGTRNLMPNQADQQRHWNDTIARAVNHPNVVLELINEAGHPSQSLDPQAFSNPAGVIASHGSGLTDAPAVKPYWDYATYHARRDRPPDARGFTNYDAYEFQAEWPKPCPFVPDEGIKPVDYGFNPDWAYQLGNHCNIHNGGTFHTQEGLMSEMWPSGVENCAMAFCSAIG